jgi:N-acetylglutamate synthase-like GNAT family acetyltransferase
VQSFIRAARRTESKTISPLAFRSKAHWGYSNEFLEACREELTYSAAKMESGNYVFRVCESDGDIVGFYALAILGPEETELEALFVEPDMIGKGHGWELIDHAKELAAGLGVRRVIIQGDPNAASFYQAAGGVADGERESCSIPGRFLPVFRIDLPGL